MGRFSHPRKTKEEKQAAKQLKEEKKHRGKQILGAVCAFFGMVYVVMFAVKAVEEVEEDAERDGFEQFLDIMFSWQLASTVAAGLLGYLLWTSTAEQRALAKEKKEREKLQELLKHEKVEKKIAKQVGRSRREELEYQSRIAAQQNAEENAKLASEMTAAQRALRDEALARERREQEISLSVKKMAEEERKIREQEAAKKSMEAQYLKAQQEAQWLRDEWSLAEQRSLERALTDYPASEFPSAHARWEKIAEAVGSRTRQECVARYKELRDKVATDKKQKEREYWEALQAVGGGENIPPEFQRPKDANDSEVDSDECGSDSDSDDDDDDSDDRDDEGDRLEIEAHPAHRGTMVQVAGTSTSVGVLQVQELLVQTSCDRCNTVCAVRLSGSRASRASQKFWCEKCCALLTLELRPCLVTTLDAAAPPTLSYVDVERCRVTDILPSTLCLTCAECSHRTITTEVVRGARLEVMCSNYECNTRMILTVRAFHVVDLQTGGAAGGGAADASAMETQLKKARARVKNDNGGRPLVEGTPLPDNGACSHFRKSYRWFRFPCCGRALPCTLCHEVSDCPASDMPVWCSRIICGKCSREQEASCKVCKFCSYAMGKDKSKAHWEAGTGSRNTQTMSNKEARKHRGEKKTTSKKAERVGVSGKLKHTKEEKS